MNDNEKETMTAEELSVFAELITYEEILCKKCKFYGNAILDEKNASVLRKTGDEAKKRLNALIEEV